MFSVEGDVVVALVSGSNRLSEPALAAAAGHPGGRVGRVDASAAKAATGFSIGGVPPFGHSTPVATFVDRDLLDYDTVWAAAGTPRHVFPISPNDLVALSGATIADLRDVG